METGENDSLKALGREPGSPWPSPITIALLLPLLGYKLCYILIFVPSTTFFFVKRVRGLPGPRFKGLFCHCAMNALFLARSEPSGVAQRSVLLLFKDFANQFWDASSKTRGKDGSTTTF